MNVCGVADCKKPHKSRGFCNAHYERLRLHGSLRTDTPLHRRSPSDWSTSQRLAVYTDKTAHGGCWAWTASTNGRGYGQVNVGGIKLAHRLAWELEHGSIPSHLEIDHLCRNRGCVNPAHMELVTSAVNTQRGVNTKLTPALVREIRNRHSFEELTFVSLAAQYGVSTTTIRGVINRTAWSNIA